MTNLHRSFYNTANAYIPLLAGTFLGELFLKSSYSKLAAPAAHENPQTIRRLLNFSEDFAKVTDRNVFPLLGLYDQFIEYDVQKESYNGHQIQTLKKGHVTAALDSAGLREHIRQSIRSFLPS